jgi:unsaturated rhamnogalacturonyl hydrolase
MITSPTPRLGLTLVFALLAVALVVAPQAARAADANAHFGEWPEGKSPKEIGDRVAKRFVESPHPNFGRPGLPNRITYPEVCAWYGGLTFAKETNNTDLREQLIKRFEPLLNEEKQFVPKADHVDHTVFAAVPFELYLQTKDDRYLKLAQPMADEQWGEPQGKAATQPAPQEYYKKGLTWQTRMWIDDMYMITAAQAQAYRATGDRKYIDRAAREMVVYLVELQKENGLFYHAPDVPFFWGRGDGWMAAGMAELLRSLPEDNADRPRIMKGYKLMMESLLKHQDENGMWHQLIDDPASWPETSCTGMFAFAYITGVKNGWLDEATYGPAARKAWLALTTYLEPNGDIREVCQGTNKKNDRQFYLDRKRITGDMHGQAPMLWCATALSRK